MSACVSENINDAIADYVTGGMNVGVGLARLPAESA